MKNTTYSNYKVGDFLIRIKNSALAGRTDVVLANTKLIKSTAEALKKEGYLSEVEVKDSVITVKIAKSHKKPLLMDLKLISKPGLRVYKSVDEIKSRKQGSSILILSTPKGVMSGKSAIKENVGGEVIVEVW